MSATSTTRRRTITDIATMYREGKRIAMVTAYDFPTARLVDEADIPIALVGDSLGQVMLGYDSTVRVTMQEMIHHTKAVVRGTKRTLVVADMPFLTYGLSTDESVANAGLLIREGAQAVKIEGGVRSARTIEDLTRNGIPVMSHIGLTPQTEHQMGGKRVQGRTRETARALLNDAFAVQEAGAFAVVLEVVPSPLAQAVTERLHIPTIGIGAGAGCSGQVQVITDLLGFTADYIPKHARQYADLRGTIRAALETFQAEVIAGTFPGEAESFSMDEEILSEVLGHSSQDRPDEDKTLIPLDRDL